jgi:integrase
MKFIYQEKEDRKKNGITFGKGEYPDCVKWITTTIKNNRKKKPEDLLNAEDVKKLANHSNNLRDRALILTLYESAARIGELQGVRVKHVDFDKYGCKMKLHGKTGDRTIRLISSAPAISNWLTDHPNFNGDIHASKYRNSYLFCSLWGKNRGDFVSYPQINLLLKDIAIKSKISKPVRPHHFRHSRATELAKRLTESQLCEYMGWVQGSKEASTYVHLSGRDTDKAILSMYGLAEEDISKDKLQPKICPRCGICNDPAAKFCSGCSLGLDEKSVMEYDQQKDQATKTGFQIESAIKDKETLIATIDALSKRLESLEKQIKK